MDAIIVKLAGKLIAGLKLAAGFIVARVMVALGLSFVTFQAVMPDIKAFIVGKTAGLDPRVIEFFGYVGFDVAITLVVSALVAQIGMRAFLAMTSQVQGWIQGAGG